MKKEKKGSKKVTSVAWKINMAYVWDQLSSYLAVDFGVALLLGLIFVYGMDMQMIGHFSVSYHRELLWDQGWKMAAYQVTGADGSLLYQTEIGMWLALLRNGALVVVTMEGIHLLALLFTGASGVRKKLQPFNEMAIQAKQLGEAVWQEGKYHHLEDAISQLKVDALDEGIHMRDRDLQGVEKAINELLERIRESYRQQARFVSDASHELRTPIAVIQGYVNMLDRWGKEDEAVLEESIGAIQNEANHMQKLVEQLLFLARGDFNRQNLDMKNVELSAIVQEVYEESLMIDENHVYRFESPGNIWVYGDFAMLKQSIRILVDNAAKYTEAGGEIVLRAGRRESGNPFYSIQDNGMGMSQQEAEHVFDRFYRADSVRNSDTGGTGLGLSIARWIVDKHKGYYEVTSHRELGTRFSVIFPSVQL